MAGQTDSQHINKSRTHLLLSKKNGTALPYVTSWFIRCKPQIVCSVLHWSSYSSDSPTKRMSMSSDLFALAHAIFKSWPVGFLETSRQAAMVQCESHLILQIQICLAYEKIETLNQRNIALDKLNATLWENRRDKEDLGMQSMLESCYRKDCFLKKLTSLPHLFCDS
jgi:hypothetical protein